MKTKATNEENDQNPIDSAKPEHEPCAIAVRENCRAMRMIKCEFDGRPAYMLKLLRACYRTREEASRAVPYRMDAVLAAAKGCGHIYAFDDEMRLWHVWTALGWHTEEDPFAPDFADMVDHLRVRAEQTVGTEDLPF